ncbi:MAG TPA: deoxynucleoside kinase [Streptosporangiaceae bacterium]|nr:deoxynucleoside kinase [Streptosporangiaceae bacterium]
MKQTGAGLRRPGVYIAIEGATGVGKTTLATKLSTLLGSTLVLDPFDRNPFLTEYCEGTPAQRETVALPMEMAFLSLRVDALRGIARLLRQADSVVADWALIKSRVFADLTLGAADADLFGRTVDLWARDLPVPDLVVHLRADGRTLAARVRGRGRSIEKGLTPAELDEQGRTFSAILAQTDLNAVTVDTSAFNVFSEHEVAALASELLHACRRAA